MNITQVSSCDIIELKKLAERSLCTDVEASAEEREYLLPHILNDIEVSVSDENCLFLKMEDDGLVGYVLIKDSWNLMHLFVDPARTSMGFGTALLVEAIARVKLRENRRYIALNSSSNAVQFYKSMGFQVDLERVPKSESTTPMRLDF